MDDYFAFITVWEIAHLTVPNQALVYVDLLASSSEAERHLVTIITHEFVYAHSLTFLPLCLVQNQCQVFNDDQLVTVRTFERKHRSISKDVFNVLLHTLDAKAMETRLESVRLFRFTAANATDFRVDPFVLWLVEWLDEIHEVDVSSLHIHNTAFYYDALLVYLQLHIF
jgi:hypothetical protein